ncbi:MAG TPA: ATPase domain-containing protein [Nitrococcus sp.]|nr:ATPase domain-containing protein [Nitrococcus sp.]
MKRLSTGIDGLDEVLHGGTIQQRSYLIRGGPGRGKTTLGLHFLAAADTGESALFIGFQEPEAQVRSNAASLGLNVSAITFLSLAPDAQFFTEQQSYDVFSAADVEQQPLVDLIIRATERNNPTRVFVDSLSQLRFLSADIFQYRKQVLSFLRYLTQQGATVLFSSESSREFPDDDLQFIADGVINLESGTSGAAIRISKMRGSSFQPGMHHMRVGVGGLTVFPRIIPPPARVAEFELRRWSTGVKKIDDILHGGLVASTVSLISGPSGIGKSTLASLFVAEAARQGHRAAVFLFEEELAFFLRRSKDLRVALEEPLADGRISIEQVEPMRYLADEFTTRVRARVEEAGVEMVVLDSVSGFELALEGEDVKERLHALAKCLTRMGVSVLLINEIEAMTGEFRISEKGISYLSDNVIFLRYVEIDGRLNKAIGILKRRLSSFDNRLHTFEIGPGAFKLGEPVHGLRGILSGAPVPQEDS